MKKPKRSSILLFLFLILWAAAMVGLVIIGFTSIQPKGIGSTGAAASQQASAPAHSNT